MGECSISSGISFANLKRETCLETQCCAFVFISTGSPGPNSSWVQE